MKVSLTHLPSLHPLTSSSVLVPSTYPHSTSLLHLVSPLHAVHFSIYSSLSFPRRVVSSSFLESLVLVRVSPPLSPCVTALFPVTCSHHRALSPHATTLPSFANSHHSLLPHCPVPHHLPHHNPLSYKLTLPTVPAFTCVHHYHTITLIRHVAFPSISMVLT